MKTLILSFLILCALAENSYMTESELEGNDDFSCKLSFTKKSPSTATSGTHTHIKVEWSENNGLWQEGDEYNICYFPLTYDGSNDVEFPATSIASDCYRSEFDGKEWPVPTAIASDKFKTTCTNASPLSTSIQNYECSILFNKGEDLGISEDFAFLRILTTDTTAVTLDVLTRINYLENTRFSDSSFVRAHYGDNTCSFASVYSAISGLAALAALALF